MVGQLVYRAGERGRPAAEVIQLYGLPIMRISLSPEGFWAERRLKQAGRLFSRRGSRRVLVPDGFEQWNILQRYGIGPVEPLPFLKAHASNLIIAGMERRGMRKEKSSVALRGTEGEGEMALAAEKLCPVVKDVCISVYRGGNELRNRLRMEYGIAVRPDSDCIDAAVRFHSETPDGGGIVLNLFSENLELNGISVTANGVEAKETQELPLLAALWENGRIDSSDLEFT